MASGAARIRATTAGDMQFNGRFRIEVREWSDLSISVDGPSCPFETYPIAAADQWRFFWCVLARPYNPITGENASIQVRQCEGQLPARSRTHENGGSRADHGASKQ